MEIINRFKFIDNPISTIDDNHNLHLSVILLSSPITTLFKEHTSMLIIDHSGKIIRKEKYPTLLTRHIESLKRSHASPLQITLTKIIHIFIAVILAPIFTPIAFLLHEIVLKTDPLIKKGYQSLDEYQKIPGLLSLIINDIKDQNLEQLKSSCDQEKLRDCFKKTSDGRSIFNELIIRLSKISSDQDNAFELNFLQNLILGAPDDCLKSIYEEYFDIRKNPFIFTHTKKTFEQINELLIQRCPAEKLHLLLNPIIASFECSDSFKEPSMQIFKEKFMQIFSIRIQQSNEERELLKKCLTKKGNNEKTLLEQKSVLSLFDNQLLKILDIDPEQLINENGLSPKDLTLKLNNDWLEDPKQIKEEEEISEQDYRTRTDQLRTDVLKLWDSIQFENGTGSETGTEKVNSSFLLVALEDPRNPKRTIQKRQTKESIRNALNIMLQKITDKEAWLGTPSKENKEELHSFYSKMLINFETVVKTLKEKSNLGDIAGYLIDISKTELEKRCGKAYQEEIEQKAQICDPITAGMTYEEILDQAIFRAFNGVVNHAMSLEGITDAHDVHEYKFASGLTTIIDPIGHGGYQDRLQTILRNIQKHFNLELFIKEIGKGIKRDALVDYVKDLIYQNRFSDIRSLDDKKKIPQYDSIILTVQAKEKELEADLKADLAQVLSGGEYHPTTELEQRRRKINAYNRLKMSDPTLEQKINAIFDAIKRSKTLVLPKLSVSNDKDELIDQMLKMEEQKISSLISSDDFDLKNIYKTHNGDSEKIQEEVIAFLGTKTKLNPLAKNEIKNTLKTCCENIQEALKFHAAITGQTTREGILSNVIAIQQDYQKKINAIVSDLEKENNNKKDEEQLDLSFNRRDFLLPSQSIEFNFKNWLAEEIINKNQMIFYILKKRGVV